MDNYYQLFRRGIIIWLAPSNLLLIQQFPTKINNSLGRAYSFCKELTQTQIVIVSFVIFYVYLYATFVNCLYVRWVCQFVSLQLNLIKTLARSSGI